MTSNYSRTAPILDGPRKCHRRSLRSMTVFGGRTISHVSSSVRTPLLRTIPRNRNCSQGTLVPLNYHLICSVFLPVTKFVPFICHVPSSYGIIMRARFNNDNAFQSNRFGANGSGYPKFPFSCTLDVGLRSGIA